MRWSITTRVKVWLFIYIFTWAANTKFTVAAHRTVSSERKKTTNHRSRAGRQRGDSSTVSSTEPCTGVPTVPSDRRACNFYIWDAPSALFYKWCHHLLKKNLYEGKGGRMFVRYESNSVLQLLYPCNRYSPNRCMICGGSFPDHLTLWWSKHLYSPICRHIDKTYNDALMLSADEMQRTKSKQSNSKKSSKAEIVTAPTFAFHRHYVLDVSHVLDGETDTRQRLRKVRRLVAKEKSWEGDSRLRYMSQKPSLAYVIPDVDKDDGRKPSMTLRILRGLVLNAVDRLLVLQERENALQNY